MFHRLHMAPISAHDRYINRDLIPLPLFSSGHHTTMANQQSSAPGGSASQAAAAASPASEANELTDLINNLLHELTVGFDAHNAEMTRLIDRMEERLDRLENNLIAIQNEQNQKSGQSGETGHST